ncbi:MAG: TylF/MycF family methyltransferase [Lapillicoccus sp.]
MLTRPKADDTLTEDPGEAGRLYLELMKRTLTGALFEESDVILGLTTQGTPTLKHRLANGVGALASRAGLELVLKRPYDPRLRETGQDWPARAESMIGLKRMDNIQLCVETVLRESVPGDLVETGVWRGGATIFMRAVLKAWGVDDRSVWAADSFEGLPKPDPRRYPADAGDTFHRYDALGVGVDQVKHNFARYGLLDEQVKFIVGWFKDTLASAPIEQIAVLRLDGDMYESTMEALTGLYPRLSVGGFLIVDDYGTVPSCKEAVHDYRSAQGIDDDIVDIDGWGVYWRRSATSSPAGTPEPTR